jgi:hypothetical protein
MKHDNAALTFDVLTDLTLSPIAALRRFVQLSQRWTPINRAFVLNFAGQLRELKMDRSYEQTSLMRWADDGGSCKEMP